MKTKNWRSIAVMVLIVLLCIGGFFFTSHLTGSVKLESEADLVSNLQQAVLSEQPPEIHKTDLTDGCLAVLFDTGDNANDLVLFVPDWLLSSRWCYLDAVSSDAPLAVYHTRVGAGSDTATLVVVYGESDQPVTVTAGTTEQTVSPDENGFVLTQFRVPGEVTPTLK